MVFEQLAMYVLQSRICLAVSVLALIVAIVMATWGFPQIIKHQIKKQVQIEPSGKMFEKWRKLPMPLTFKIYVFNVTNPDEINKGEKPKLQEIGPYVYDQYRERNVISYGENDTVKYTLKKTFVFNKNLSGGLSDDDALTVINFSYMAAILTVYEMMPAAVGMVNGALEEFFTNLTDPFLRIRAGDLFFDGIFLNCEGESSTLGLVCGRIRSDKPPTMRATEDGKGFYFSMFSHLNLTETGPYEMVRGTENIKELGHIVSYKGKTKMSNWGNMYCGQMNGSDSTVYPPIDNNEIPDKLYTFEPDICRSMYVNFVGKSTLFDMSAYYYEMSRMPFASKSAEPNNKCFCRKNWSANHDGCLMMGLLNLMPCQGAPAIASLPHFYLASEEILEYFAAGLKPDKDKHTSYVYIEPSTGVVLKGSKKLQFNVELRQIKDVPQLENVPTGLFPLLWIDEGAEIPLSIQQELKDGHKILGYVETFRWALVVLSVLSIIFSGILVVRNSSIPIWPKNTNSISFIMSPGQNNTANGNKAF